MGPHEGSGTVWKRDLSGTLTNDGPLGRRLVLEHLNSRKEWSPVIEVTSCLGDVDQHVWSITGTGGIAKA